MKKRISALLLSLVLCLGLVGTAFAVEVDPTISKVTVTDGKITVTGTGEPGKTYLLCSVAIGGEVDRVFNLEVPASGSFTQEFTVPGVTTKDSVSVSIPLANGEAETGTYTPSTTPSRPGGGGGGGGGGGSTSYAVKVAKTEHGKVTVRPDSAVKDQKVTITVTPDKGYALDTLTVTDANGKEVTLTKVNDTTYTFLMPGTAVTVEATFKATGEDTGAPSFSDVADKNYTFYADIMWAAEKGYMNGYSDGTFRPNNNTTRQALWMVLARIDGANPSDMTAARAWAMNSKISDGTNPGAAMSRQQMVTMLYRYAQLKGYKTSGGTSIDAYPDAANVASYAKDALSWAIGNGIVKGTSDGLLNPTGTASRAHFAAFLHRFCTTAEIA